MRPAPADPDSRDPGPVAVVDLADTPAGEIFDRWEAMMSEAYVPLAVTPTRSGLRDFHGRITSGAYGDLRVSRLITAGQTVRRTAGLISRASHEYLLASIHTAGNGILYQGDRVASVGPGEMVFYDTTVPYHWEIDKDFEQVVVQVPLETIFARLRRRTALPTAVTVPAHGVGSAVSGFFRGLAQVQERDAADAAVLAEQATDLLVSAVTILGNGRLAPESAEALSWEKVVRFVRDHCGDPELGIEAIARACHMSRRTLYRLCTAHHATPGDLLRRLRVRRAEELMRTERPLAAIAAAAGFSSERHFYRAFRLETGLAPGRYRRVGTHGQSSGTV
ncbi:helix-turn-helix domain-containing protein [Nocardia thailandica]